MKRSITAALLFTVVSTTWSLQAQTKSAMKPPTPVSILASDGTATWSLDPANGWLYQNFPDGTCKSYSVLQDTSPTTFVVDGEHIWIGYQDGSLRKYHWPTRTIAMTLPSTHSGAVVDLTLFGNYVIRLTVYSTVQPTSDEFPPEGWTPFTDQAVLH